MIDSLTILIVSFIYSALLCFVYLKNNRSLKQVNRLLGFLLIVNFFGHILSMASVFIFKKFTLNSVPTLLVNKILLEYYSLFAYLFTVYALVATSSLESKQLNKYARNIKNLGLVAFILITLIIAILPVNFYNEGLNLNQAGPAAIASIIFMGISLIFSLNCILRGILNKKKKTILPLVFYIFGIFISLLVQFAYRSLNITIPIQAFILYLVYFSLDKDGKVDTTYKEAENINDKVEAPEEIEKEEDELSNDLDLKIEHEDVMEKYNTKELLKNVIDYAKEKFDEKNIMLKTSIDSSIPTSLFGEQTKVRDIFTNLIDNVVSETDSFVHLKIDAINKGEICKFIVSIEEDFVLNVNPPSTIFETKSILRKVKNLAESLNGKVAIKGDKNTKYIVSFEQKIDTLGSIGIKVRRK